MTVRRRQLQLAGVTAVPSSFLLLVKLGAIPSDSENVLLNNCLIAGIGNKIQRGKMGPALRRDRHRSPYNSVELHYIT